MESSRVHPFHAAGQALRRPIGFIRRAPGRTLWVALATLGVGGGLFLGWDWLAAAGLTSVVVGLLPCAAMCAAGLCAGRHGKQGSCHGGAAADSGDRP
ncbi:hypothetical protein [Aromatoleum toluclasticum]|uniref:hypothetical protein n=1 Tax=Aromatoleum toluclasticum TaxID=92003 RepID=UPI00036D5112|nr:hypothetical protein [Aromatoleum toluclasticum]